MSEAVPFLDCTGAAGARFRLRWTIAAATLAAGALLAGVTMAQAEAGRSAEGAGVSPRVPGPVRIAHFPSIDPASDTLVVQNVGVVASRVVVAWFGDACPACCSAPLAVTASPPIAAGASWPLVPPDPEARYATVFSVLNTAQGRDLGCDDPRCITDSLIEDLKGRLPGDCAEYRRFAKAFAEGLPWGSVPLDWLAGPPVAAWVEGPEGAGGATAAWRRDAGELGSYDPRARGYRYLAPLVTDESVIAIQNAGLYPASATVSLVDAGDAPHRRWCGRLRLGAASRALVRVAACVAAGWSGGAVATTSGPAAVQITDPAGAYGAAPGLPYSGPPALYGPASRDVVPLTVPLPTVGRGAVVAVQNSSDTNSARVHVTFLSRRGYTVGGLTTWIPPAGISHVDLETVLGGEPLVASVRLMPQALPDHAAPLLAVVARLGRTGLLPASEGPPAADWPPASYMPPDDPGLVDDNTWRRWSAAGLLAIPDLSVPPDPAQRVSLYALNTAPIPGRTWIIWQVYDANGLVGALCDKLRAGESAFYPIDSLFLAPGFRGTAYVSATLWEHDLFSSTGRFVGNELGLAAGVVRWGADGAVHTAPAVGYRANGDSRPPLAGDEPGPGAGPPCPFWERGGGVPPAPTP